VGGGDGGSRASGQERRVAPQAGQRERSILVSRKKSARQSTRAGAADGVAAADGSAAEADVAAVLAGEHPGVSAESRYPARSGGRYG
jgi:hypothetical protein